MGREERASGRRRRLTVVARDDVAEEIQAADVPQSAVAFCTQVLIQVLEEIVSLDLDALDRLVRCQGERIELPERSHP